MIVGTWETGHTVVYLTTVWVTFPVGQLVTEAGQEVMVYWDVEYTVEVTYSEVAYAEVACAEVAYSVG